MDYQFIPWIADLCGYEVGYIVNKEVFLCRLWIGLKDDSKSLISILKKLCLQEISGKTLKEMTNVSALN